MAIKQNKDSGQSNVGNPTTDYDAGRMTVEIQTFSHSADSWSLGGLICINLKRECDC